MDPATEALRARKLLFIVGVFRSGTSLLHRIVTHHPEVRLMWEADPLRFLAAKTCRSWPKRLDLWNGCISRHRIDPSKLPIKTTREEAAIALYSAYAADAAGARVIGEKSPYYSDILPRLAHSFPLASFLIIHRDPGATLASVKNAAQGNRYFSAPWMPLRVVKDAGRLRRDAGRLRQRGHSVREIEFEQLLQSPDRTVHQIWQWLGVGPPDSIGDGAAPLPLPPGDHHRLVRGRGIDPARAHVQDENRNRLVERYRSFRGESDASGPKDRPSPLNAVLLGRDEAAYHAIMAAECARRMAFRNAPVCWLERHRRRSNHAVC